MVGSSDNSNSIGKGMNMNAEECSTTWCDAIGPPLKDTNTPMHVPGGQFVTTTTTYQPWAWAACLNCAMSFDYIMRDRQRRPLYCSVCQP